MKTYKLPVYQVERIHLLNELEKEQQEAMVRAFEIVGEMETLCADCDHTDGLGNSSIENSVTDYCVICGYVVMD